PRRAVDRARRMSMRRLALAGLALALACDPPEPQLATQGTSVQPGPCGRGLLVVESDYQSSNVALVGFDGALLSPSFVHSSAESGGYGVSIGGDAVPPGSAQSGASVALIDRTPSGVVHWLDVASARPVLELNVDTGFRSNPHDYLALDSSKAYLTRYDAN